MKQNLTKIPNTIDELYEWSKSRILCGRQQKMLRFKTLLELLNISIAPSRVVKLAGTNGKGSVAAMLEAIFLADNQKVLLFTSPHLSRITERFRVNGVEISKDVLDDAVGRIAPELVRIIKQHGSHLLPSFFEVLTLIALNHFSFSRSDIIILEAGIGGYNDVVHLVDSEVSIITSVGLDHSNELGTTLSQIATDKVGIASPNSTLVLGPDIPKSAREAILKNAKDRGISLISSRLDIFKVQSLGFQGHQVTLDLGTASNTFKLPLVGSFQLENLATVKSAVDILRSKHILNSQQSFLGVSQVCWSGRMELIDGNPAWLIDTAHNVHAIEKITTELPQLAKDKEVVILLGLSDHNNIADLAPCLNKLGETIKAPIYLTSGFYRSIEPLTYISIFQNQSSTVTNLGDYKSAINKLLSIYQNKENVLIFITGSLFLIGAFREYLLSSKN